MTTLVVTLIFGRFFCGWACHVVAYQDLCAWLLGKLGARPRAVRSRLLAIVPVYAAFDMFVWPAMWRFSSPGASTESDGSLFAYLEDVSPDGSVTYLTEGEIRLLHRRPCAEPVAFNAYGPCHSYASDDAQPMPPEELQEVTIGLHPISALLRAGHSIRIALAGHDASSFERIPATATPVWSVAHDPEHPSRIDLPVASRGRDPIVSLPSGGGR